MLNGLDLFSGIGGITLALSPWVRPVAYCENDRYAMSVLLSRMSQGALPVAPIWDDVRTLKGSYLPSTGMDIIYGGFPCQDISLAGTRMGLAGKRSALLWELVRLTEELMPRFVFIENVWPGISREVETITNAFEKLGYRCRDGIFGAGDVGSPQNRERWFMLAHLDGFRGFKRKPETEVCRRNAIDLKLPDENLWSSFNPEDFRMVDGLPHRVDRIRGLGNSVVPAQAREAFRILLGER